MAMAMKSREASSSELQEAQAGRRRTAAMAVVYLWLCDLCMVIEGIAASFYTAREMGSRAYPTEDFGMASWAGLVSEARAYDTDTLQAACHDERVKKSTRRGGFVIILCILCGQIR